MHVCDKRRSYLFFTSLIMAFLGTSCGNPQGNSGGSTGNTVQATSATSSATVDSNERAYTFLNATPEIASQVSVPSAAEQAALDAFNASKGGKLIEAFNMKQPSAPAPSREIGFSEGTYSTPYLVCYYNVTDPTTKATRTMWKWALNSTISGGFFGNYWKNNGYYNFKRADGKELRNPSLAFVSDKTDAALKQVCENTRQYWMQPKSSWAYSDVLDPTTSQLPSNAKFAYYTEAKSSFGYNRYVFPTDKPPRTKFTSLVVFGDSLSDTGNLFRRTGKIVPREDYYYSGRFTNGFNWMDSVENTLNLPVFNSAYASSETNNDVNYGLPLSVLDAIEDYKAKKGVWNLFYYDDKAEKGISSPFYYGGYIGQADYGKGDPETTLFAVYAGGNNYLGFVKEPPFPNGLRYKDPLVSGAYLDVEGFTTQTATDFKTAANSLISIGAKFILFPNLPDLSKVPQGIASGAAPLLSAAVKMHNTKLYNATKELAAAHPGVTFIYMDVYSMFDEMSSKPSVYGFQNIDKPCYVGKYWRILGETKPTVCGDESVQRTYVFWDTIHPTKRAHGFIAYLINNYLFNNFKR